MTPAPLPPHLQPDREIHVVISLLSGHQKAQSYYDCTLKPFLDSHEDLVYKTHTTRSAKTIIELTESTFLFNAKKGVKQTIILLSGDGGLVDIVNTMSVALMRSHDDIRPPSIFLKPSICLIPMGTANAMAWSAGIAQDPVKTLLEGRAQSVPSFEVTVSEGARLVTEEGSGREEIEAWNPDGKVVLYGAVVFSWGLHASLVAMSDTSEYRKHGLERFQMAAQELLKEPHRYRGRVKFKREGEEEWVDFNYAHEGERNEHAYVLATLVSNLEEKFRISPASKPLEGKLRLLAFGPQSSQEIMRILQLAYQDGKHVEETDVVRYEEIETLRIEFEEPDPVWRQTCVDGKIVEIDKDGWVEARRLPGYGVDGRRVVELVRPRQ